MKEQFVVGPSRKPAFWAEVDRLSRGEKAPAKPAPTPKDDPVLSAAVKRTAKVVAKGKAAKKRAAKKATKKARAK